MPTLSDEQVDFLISSISPETFNTRISNTLRNAGISRVGNILSLSDRDIKLFPNLGTKSFEDIRVGFEEKDLSLDGLRKYASSDIISAINVLRDNQYSSKTSLGVREKLFSLELLPDAFVSLAKNCTVPSFTEGECLAFAAAISGLTNLHPVSGEFQKIVARLEAEPQLREAFLKFSGQAKQDIPTNFLRFDCQQG